MIGRARAESEIIDLSVTAPTGFKGIAAVIGVTELGEVGKTVSIGSWVEYRRHFGGLLEDNQFPLLCKRILERGSRIRVTRAAHYTDIEDAGTVDGTKATKVVGKVEATAKGIGAGYDKISLEFVDAKSGNGGFDLILTHDGFPELNQTIVDIPATPSEEDLLKVNNQLRHVQIKMDGSETTIVEAKGALTGGAQTIASIVAADYIGSEISSTGIRAFDEDTDFVRIAAPAIALPEVDAALVAYAELRGDCRAWLRTPTGIDGETAKDYRNGKGIYSHTAINSWYGSMVFGGLKVTDPLTGEIVVIPALADVLGAAGAKDVKNLDWFATAGQKRGRIFNTHGVEYNLGSAGRASEFDALSLAGVNAVIDDKDFGVCYWDVNTLQKTDTMLKFESIGELLIYLSRALLPIAKAELFDPNDVDTWKTIWRKSTAILDQVKDARGIWDYKYEGDQFIDSVDEAQVNDPLNIDSGKYVARIFIKPKAPMKYTLFQMVVTNSGVSFDLLTDEL